MAVAEERESRSVALETAYVHDVYDQISAHCSCCPASSCSCSSLQAGAEVNGTSARVWPRVRQFLQDLEPGSLVCDVGCGSGKYLHVNPDVFKVGADRCARLTELAREKEHEVMVCDNLALPFRDDSFDAVLSVAVVHHFATTERRVNALRELARVLRIGGRLLISVWAMEQRHRKFESQDVLVPWHRPQQQHLSTPSLELTSTATTCTTTSEEADAGGPPPYHAYTQTSDSDSARSVRVAGQQQAQPRKRGKSRHKGRSIDPARPSSSQSSSDLSSPNETCYSFVRRALQKLAGGRRGATRHRAWFLDSWSACTKEPVGVADLTPEGLLAEAGRRAVGRDDSQDDVADALDLPIELRRLEDVEPSPPVKSATSPPRRRRTLACSIPTPPRLEPTPLKSQSLGDILDTARPESLVRSRSSVARLPIVPPQPPVVEATDLTVPSVAVQSNSSGGSPVTSSAQNTSTPSHPPLVRQKRSLCEDDEEGEEAAREAEDRPGPAPTRRSDLRDLIRALPEVGGPRRGVPKQRSLNDELMAMQRQREKARVRQNITKQASLNEQLLSSSRGTLGSLKDSLLASPRFQQLRSGLTKLTSISAAPSDATKVASQSFKNGFVRMLQGWKGEAAENPSSPHLIPPTSPLRPVTPQLPITPPPVSPLRRTADEDPITGLAPIASRCERRLSREEGSDSSKDSSLQSDTSVDSEDSFASVIFVPKPEAKFEGPSAPSPPTTEKSPPPNSNNSQAPPQILLLPVSPKEKEAVVLETRLEPKPESPPLQPRTGTIRAETLKRIQQLLQERAPRAPVFPLVRRSSAHPVGRSDQSLARPIPRLLSLELFNPETDDLDSDSSGVSSPDSVISVMEPGGRNSPLTCAATEMPTVYSSAPSPPCKTELVVSDVNLPASAIVQQSGSRASSTSLLEAAASVASSLEGAVDAVIQSSPRARRKLAAMGLRGSPSPPPPPVPPRPPLWDEECRQHLTEFADRLSEKLLQEIDRYSEICTLQSGGTSRHPQFRTMARFPREHDRFSPEPCQDNEDEDSQVVTLDPERYLQDLQEINSDIGSQLAKLHEELDALPLNLNHNNNNNSPRIQSPNNNNNSNHIKNNNTEEAVLNLVSSPTTPATTTTTTTNKMSSPDRELPDLNENNKTTDMNNILPEKNAISVVQMTEKEVTVSSGSLTTSLSPSQSITGPNLKSPSSSLSGPEAPTRQVSWEESVIGSSPDLRRTTSKDSAGEEIVGTCTTKSKHKLLTRQQTSITGWPELETVPPKVITKTESYETSISGSTSQDSIQSSSAGSGGPIGAAGGGGALTFHRYYHVFREGELDTLIERYVENLHIISSYYDHANWCVIAEKVQVWTI